MVGKVLWGSVAGRHLVIFVLLCCPKMSCAASRGLVALMCSCLVVVVLSCWNLVLVLRKSF